MNGPNAIREANDVHQLNEVNEQTHALDSRMTDDAMDLDDGCEVYEDELEGLDSLSEGEDGSEVFQME